MYIGVAQLLNAPTPNSGEQNKHVRNFTKSGRSLRFFHFGDFARSYSNSRKILHAHIMLGSADKILTDCDAKQGKSFTAQLRRFSRHASATALNRHLT